jgi:hypothetical protein
MLPMIDEDYEVVLYPWRIRIRKTLKMHHHHRAAAAILVVLLLLLVLLSLLVS